MLYTGEQRLACYVEVLAQFRPALALLTRAGETSPEPGDVGDLAGAGRIPANWHLIRRIGWLEPDPDLRALDLRAIETRAVLRRDLAPFLIQLGYTDFDLGDALNRDRRLTQHISRWAYDLGYRAIAYTSRFGAELACWVLHRGTAIPEEPLFTPLGTAAIERDDPDLVEAARLLGLRL